MNLIFKDKKQKSSTSLRFRRNPLDNIWRVHFWSIEKGNHSEGDDYEDENMFEYMDIKDEYLCNTVELEAGVPSVEVIFKSGNKIILNKKNQTFELCKDDDVVSLNFDI